jgi:hypothetical protein
MLAGSFGWSPFKVNHEGSPFALLAGLLFIVVPWLYFFREEKKLGDQLMDDEGIMVEWELKYIASKRGT